MGPSLTTTGPECSAEAPAGFVGRAGSNPAPDTGTWAKHAPATTYCLVVSVDDSSWRTACRGAWNSSDLVEIHDNPPADQRCKECVRKAGE